MKTVLEINVDWMTLTVEGEVTFNRKDDILLNGAISSVKILSISGDAWDEFNEEIKDTFERKFQESAQYEEEFSRILGLK